MLAYKARVKDKRCQIFTRINEDNEDGSITYKKVYLHSSDTYLKCYVRGASASERDSSNETQADDRIEVTINYKSYLEGMHEGYLEFDGRTYSIVGIDPLEFKRTEMKLSCLSIEPPTFDSVSYTSEEVGS